METTISWAGFNGERFQLLGNCLVYTPVFKQAKLFSAAGKDHGIDHYGDLAVQIDLNDAKGNVFLPVQYMNYSGGMEAEDFAASIAVDPSVVEGFTAY